MKPGNKLTVFTLVLCWMLTLAFSASAEDQLFVSPEVHDRLSRADSVDMIVHFKGTPDLSAAYKMEWSERGHWVHDQMNAASERAQQALRAQFGRSGTSYQVLENFNMMVIPDADYSVLDSIVSDLQVKGVFVRPDFHLMATEQDADLEGVRAGPRGIEANIAQIKASDVWNDLGITGEGAVIGINDTVPHYTHDALVNSYRGNIGGGNFDHDYAWYYPGSGHLVPPLNDHYHGSHVAGIAVGDDGADNQIGVAPGAEWMACGGCLGGSCPQVVQCLNWFVAPTDVEGSNADPDMRPHVVNNSWGDCAQAHNSGVYTPIFDTMLAAGVIPVFSNGNNNSFGCGYPAPPGLNTVGDPARHGRVLGIGSTSRSGGNYATHSNWGPTDNDNPGLPGSFDHFGYPDLKPNVSAPGSGIRAAGSANNSDYISIGGTSMASPHAAGVVALMVSAAPVLAGDMATIGSILQSTANHVAYTGGGAGDPDVDPGVNHPNYASGWGEIDALAAVQEAIAQTGGAGTIAGEVVDSNDDPIEGVRVEFEYFDPPPAGYVAMTDAAGQYSQDLLAVEAGDGYNITFSKFGYVSHIETGVEVADEQVVTLDVELESSEPFVLSGTVTDSITDFPLAATITFPGTPVGSVPVAPNGEYSVTLPSGMAFEMVISADTNGYLVGNETVGPLTADLTHDIELDADLVACSAPGYSVEITSHFSQDFEADNGGFTTSGPAPAPWQWGTPSVWPNGCGEGDNCWGTNLSGNYNSSSNETLSSPPIDLAGISADALLLRWNQANHVETHNWDQAFAEISIDGGPWTVLWQNPGSTVAEGWRELEFDITDAAGGEIELRWRMVSDGSVNYPGVYIDNVRVEEQGCLPGNPPPQIDVDATGFNYVVEPGAVEDEEITITNWGGEVLTFNIETAAEPAGQQVLPPFTVDSSAARSDLSLDLAELLGGELPSLSMSQGEYGLRVVDCDSEPGIMINDDGTVENGYGANAAVVSEVRFVDRFTPAEYPAMLTGVCVAFITIEGTTSFNIEVIAYDDSGAGGTPGVELGRLAATVDVDQLNPPIPPNHLPIWNSIDLSSLGIMVTDGSVYVGVTFVPQTISTFMAADQSTDRPVGHAGGFWWTDNNGAWVPIQTDYADYRSLMVRPVLETGLADCADPDELSWLSLTPDSGELDPLGDSTTVSMELDTDGLADGTYESAICITSNDPNNPVVRIPVSVLVTNDPIQPVAQVSPTSLTFNAVEGDAGSQALNIDNPGNLPLEWTIAEDVDPACAAPSDVSWLALSNDSGTTPAFGSMSIDVLVDSSGLTEGLHEASLCVSTNDPDNGLVIVPVELEVVDQANYAIVDGTVESLGYCGENPSALAGASVEVQGAFNTFTATTDGSGYFSIGMHQQEGPVDVYVTANSHQDDSASGVVLVGDDTTTVDFSLIMDGVCATVDPAEFNLQVVYGTTEDFDLTIGNEAGTIDLDWLIETYRPSQRDVPIVAFSEDFEGSFPPADWTVIDDGTGCPWISSDDAGLSGWNGTDRGAAADADQCGSGTQADTSLISPSIDLTGLTATELSFDLAHRALSSTVTVDISTDSGVSWTNLDTWTANFAYPGDDHLPVVLDLSDYDNETDVQLRWRYTGGWAWWVFIDNVRVGEGPASCENLNTVPWLSVPASGTAPAGSESLVPVTVDATDLVFGEYSAALCIETSDNNAPFFEVPVNVTVNDPSNAFFSGNVTGQMCGEDPFALEGAVITIEGATETYTTETDENGDYFVLVHQDVSPVDVTVSHAGYLSESDTGINFAGSDIVELDYNLTIDAGCIDVTPDELAGTVDLGSTLGLDFEVANFGASALEWSILDPSSESRESDPLIGFNFTAATSANPDPQNWQRIGEVDGLLDEVYDDTGALTGIHFEWGGVGASQGPLYLNTSTLAADAVPMYDYDLSGMTGYGFRSGGRLFIELSNLQPNADYEYWMVAYRATSGFDNLVEVSSGNDLNAFQFKQTITTANNGGRFVINDLRSDDTQDFNELSFVTRSSSDGTIRIEWEGDTDATVVIGAFAIRQALDCDLPDWLSAAPDSGNIGVGDPSQTVTATLDPAGMAPGVYEANLCLQSNDPVNPIVEVPVTMTAELPASWASISGTVSGLGHCSADPSVLAGATVSVEGQVSDYQVETDENGFYELYLSEDESAVTINVTADGHLGDSETVTFQGGDAETVDFDLLLEAGCTSNDPANIDVVVDLNATATEVLTLINDGFADSSFEITTAEYAASGLDHVIQRAGFAAHSVVDDGNSRASGEFSARAAESREVTLNIDRADLSVVVISPDDVQPTNLVSDLSGFPGVTAELYSGSLGTITGADLAGYDVAVLVNNNPWEAVSANVSVGDALADFIDAGGSAVVFNYAYDNPAFGWQLNGRFIDDDYGPFQPAFAETQVALDMVPVDAGHPILDGVVSAATTGLVTNHQLQPDATLIAEWSNGWPLIAANDNVVAINILYSAAGAAGFWTGDFDLITFNAVTYIAGDGGGGPPAETDWLSVDPASGTVFAGDDTDVNVMFDPSGLSLGTYTGDIFVNVDEGAGVSQTLTVPVSMTVELPATWGALSGTIMGLGHCGTDPSALAGASVEVVGSMGSYSVETDADGFYEVYLPADESPLTITASAEGHHSDSTSVNISAGEFVTADIDLLLDAPCAAVMPESISVNLDAGTSTSGNIELNNYDGAGTLIWSIDTAQGSLADLYRPDPEQIISGERVSTPSDVLISSGEVSLSQADLAELVRPRLESGPTLSVDGMTSSAGYGSGDPFNSVVNLDIGVGNAMTGIAWEVNIEAYTPSWIADSQLVFVTNEGDDTGLFLTPGVNVNNSGSQDFSSEGILMLADAGIDPVQADANGNLYIEWTDTFVDISGGPDAIWMDSANPLVTLPGLRLICADQAACDAAVSGDEGPGPGPGPFQCEDPEGISWLSATPSFGLNHPGTASTINVGLDATGLQPGEYHAGLCIASNDPVNPILPVPVSLNVRTPTDWGHIEGTVTSLGYCSDAPAPLEGAQIVVTGSNGSYTETTDADGNYSLSAPDADAPYEVTVTHPDHLSASQSGVTPPATVDFDLVLDAACATVDPEEIVGSSLVGGVDVQTLTIGNLGVADLNWDILFGEAPDGVVLQPLGEVTEISGAEPSEQVQGLASAGTGIGQTVVYPFIEPQRGDTTITHSSSLGITPLNTVACFNQGSGWSLENQFLRTFVLDDFGLDGGFDVSEVTFGIETLSVNMDITVNLYTLEGAFTYANMTLIGTTTQNISAQDETLVTVPVEGSAPAGSTLVVEIAAPSQEGIANARFFAGSNNAGQTAPSYLASEACGSPEPSDYAALGFPEVQLVMTVTGSTGGSCAVGTDIPWLSTSPTSGTVAGGDSTTVDVLLDASGLAPGTYEAELCVNSNDASNPLISVPVTFDVLGSPDDGILEGTVSSLGYCSDDPSVLEGAQIEVEGSLGGTYSATTDANGFYQVFVDAGESPITVSVSADDHLGDSVSGIGLVAQETTVVDFDLVLEVGCTSHDPDRIDVQVNIDGNTSRLLSLINDGGLDSSFTITSVEQTTSTVEHVIQRDGRAAVGDRSADSSLRASGAMPAVDPYEQTIQLDGDRQDVSVLVVSPDGYVANDAGQLVPPTNLVNDLNAFPGVTADLYDEPLLSSITVADLEAYDVVVTTNNLRWSAAGADVATGNALADYVDQGGHVILHNFALDSIGWELAGRYITEGYTPMTLATSDVQGEVSMVPLDPGHPMFENVSSVGYGINFRMTGQTTNAGAEVLAEWSDGVPMLTMNEHSVSINAMYSSEGMQGDWTGDLNILVYNAVQVLAGSGGQPADWLSFDPEFGTVPAGSSSNVNVLFDADGLAEGLYEADILVDVDEGGGHSQLLTVPVTMEVLPLDPSELGVDPAALDFGEVLVDADATQSFSVTNLADAGSAALVLTDLELSGDVEFSISGGDCALGTVLEPGESCLVEISFAPGAVAAFTGEVTIATHDEQATVALSGNGVVLDPGALELTPAEHDFGVVMLGDSSSFEFTVTNSAPAGHAAVTVNSLSVVGSGDFADSGNGSCELGTTALEPGESCTVEIVFTPSAVGGVLATLLVEGTGGEIGSATMMGTGSDEEPPVDDQIFSDRFEG